MDAENTALRASQISRDRIFDSAHPTLLFRLNFPLCEKKASAFGWFLSVHQLRLSHSRMQILQPSGCNGRTGTLKTTFSRQIKSYTSSKMRDHDHRCPKQFHSQLPRCRGMRRLIKPHTLMSWQDRNSRITASDLYFCSINYWQ